MAVVASVIFVLFWCAVLWFAFGLFVKRDELPLRVRRNALLWGALGATVISTILQVLVSIVAAKVYRERQVFDFFIAVFAGPPIEEIAKALYALFACVVLGIKGRRALLVLGAMSGIGFEFVEGLGAVLVEIRDGSVNDWTHQLTARVFSLGHQHAAYTGFTGLGIAFAATRKSWFERIGFVALGLSVAIGFHSTFNALAQAIDAGEGKEGWAYTWSLNRKLIAIYVGMFVVALYRREKAHWAQIARAKRGAGPEATGDLGFQ